MQGYLEGSSIVFFVVYIVVYSYILKWMRELLSDKSLWLEEFVHCPFCVSCWVVIVIAYIYNLNVFLLLLLANMEIGIVRKLYDLP
jgi:hypothetical protein